MHRFACPRRPTGKVVALSAVGAPLAAAALALAACQGQVRPDTLDEELAAVVEEFRGDHDRFGVLFGHFEGGIATVSTAGDIEPGDHLRLASTSKPFWSFLALREGLRPEATIHEFYPADRYPRSAAITVRHLLNHTSGMPDEFALATRELGEDVDPAVVLQTIQQVISRPAEALDARIAALYNPEVGFDFEPGSMWCYSNTGYLMVGHMLERHTGESAEALLAGHFGDLAPSLYLDDGREASFPAGYMSPWPVHWSRPWVAGGLVARAEDALAAFHHLSEQPEFEVMQEWVDAPRCDLDVVFGDDYGLGLQRYALEGLGDAIGHDGHITARTMLFRLGESSYLVHVTGFVSNPELKAIAERLLRAARG